MLDAPTRKVLKYFIKTNSPQSWDTIACNIKLDDDINKSILLIETALDNLVETNCIKSVKYGYKLTNFGRMYFKTIHNNFFYKYIYPILTASVSLILSLILK